MMNDQLISQFIDDELDLEEKVEFVETVHASRPYTLETVALLRQEQVLRKMAEEVPIPRKTLQPPSPPPFRLHRYWRQGAGLAAAAMLVMSMALYFRPTPQAVPELAEHRFVLFFPDEARLAVTGTFTDWHPVPMQRIGTTGYWSLTLKVPKGEHRYSYVVEDGEMMADPTIVAREMDDFGGENSVLVIGGSDEPVS